MYTVSPTGNDEMTDFINAVSNSPFCCSALLTAGCSSQTSSKRNFTANTSLLHLVEWQMQSDGRCILVVRKAPDTVDEFGGPTGQPAIFVLLGRVLTATFYDFNNLHSMATELPRATLGTSLFIPTHDDRRRDIHRTCRAIEGSTRCFGQVCTSPLAANGNPVIHFPPLLQVGTSFH